MGRPYRLQGLMTFDAARGWDNLASYAYEAAARKKVSAKFEGYGKSLLEVRLVYKGIELGRWKRFEGKVYEVTIHNPEDPPCAGCPENRGCSDWELCHKKGLSV